MSSTADSFVQRLWYGQSWSALSVLLLPLSWLYGFVAVTRRAAYRSGLLRTVTMKQGAGILGTVTQVIGWDPALQQVRSWTFDSDGGFGSELWTKDGKRWVLEATGMRRDGGRTQATNVLIPAGTDSFTWQSVARRVAGARLPDTAELKVHRVKDKK